MIPPQRMTQAYLNHRMANQGASDSYTEYRSEHQSDAVLRRRIVQHLFDAVDQALKAAIRRMFGQKYWRINRAFADYHRARARYLRQLLSDADLRKMVLRDDWLVEEA
jgi:hypothetical protein